MIFGVMELTLSFQSRKSARALFRNAQLSAKRAAEAAKQRERALLCASLQHAPTADNANPDYTSPDNPSTTTTNNNLIPRRRGPEKPSSDPDAILADTSSDVVAALRRTHALLSTELTRSRFAQETLEQSSAALADLSENYSSVNDLLGASKALVGELLRSQKSDSWYLQTALYLLVGTLGWLIFRRFLWGPIWLLFWLPLRTVYAVLGWTLGLVGLGFEVGGSGSGSGAAAESSVVAASLSGAAATAFGSTSLIVKPSATGKPPERRDPAGSNQPSVHVGMGGGKGAGQQQEQQRQAHGIHFENEEESYVDRVGDMIKENNKDEGQAASSSSSSSSQAKGKGKKEEQSTSEDEKKKPKVVYRGDGQPLVQSDAPRNPKKRMMEEPPIAKEKDEL